jgi:hypothetical protein
MNILDWIKTNWEQVLAAYAALVTLASIITKLTPTLADDAFLLKITKFVAKFIALNDSRNHDELRDVE